MSGAGLHNHETRAGYGQRPCSNGTTDDISGRRSTVNNAKLTVNNAFLAAGGSGNGEWKEYQTRGYNQVIRLA